MRFVVRISLFLCFVVPAVAQELPEGPGKQEVQRVCSVCHRAEAVIGLAHTRAEWEQLLDEMGRMGADATEEQWKAILDYLAKNFPKVSPAATVTVNKATAKDLETALELTAKDAQAIVDYREKNGIFKTFEDLQKVPGIDIKTLEARKDRLDFHDGHSNVSGMESARHAAAKYCAVMLLLAGNHR